MLILLKVKSGDRQSGIQKIRYFLWKFFFLVAGKIRHTLLTCIHRLCISVASFPSRVQILLSSRPTRHCCFASRRPRCLWKLAHSAECGDILCVCVLASDGCRHEKSADGSQQRRSRFCSFLRPMQGASCYFLHLHVLKSYFLFVVLFALHLCSLAARISYLKW